MNKTMNVWVPYTFFYIWFMKKSLSHVLSTVLFTVTSSNTHPMLTVINYKSSNTKIEVFSNLWSEVFYSVLE